MIEIKEVLSESDIERIVLQKEQICLAPEVVQHIEGCYDFLKTFSAQKIIYGINTGFGPMAQWRIKDEDLKALQYNIIRSHSTGAGRSVDPLYVRAAMVARLQTFVQAKSGVHIDLVNLLVEFINRGILSDDPRTRQRRCERRPRTAGAHRPHADRRGRGVLSRRAVHNTADCDSKENGLEALRDAYP
jgi:histidine ammonia-lyase